MLRLIALLIAASAAAGCMETAPAGRPAPAGAGAEVSSSVAGNEPDRASPPVARGGRPDPALAGEQDPALQQPKVQPLVYADFENRIESGVGCSFTSGGGETLLVATAPMDSAARAEGVIKVAGEVKLLRATQPGGYQALAGGQTLANDRGWSAFVRRLPGQGRAAGTEVTSWPASLIVAMEGGGSVTFENGRWSCGA